MKSPRVLAALTLTLTLLAAALALDERVVNLAKSREASDRIDASNATLDRARMRTFD